VNRYIDYLNSVGADKIPHRESDLLTHSRNVSDMLRAYGRPEGEQVAGLFHSVYGTEFQQYKITIPRDTIRDLIGEYSESIVNLFCTLNDRVHTILYGKGLKDPIKTTLRWLEYCNIKEQDPNAQILREFELVLKVKVNVDSSVQKM
tara:strand:- start:255 stop:695 length:441 start_codon:yes stop_codon:yes gene_type:complete